QAGLRNEGASLEEAVLSLWRAEAAPFVEAPHRPPSLVTNILTILSFLASNNLVPPAKGLLLAPAAWLAVRRQASGQELGWCGETDVESKQTSVEYQPYSTAAYRIITIVVINIYDTN
ncbi:hypothetical protein P7K49_034230, partial [Saguinus oedipus]